MLNNGRCESCHLEPVCAYPYKPTECANQRKFRLNPEAVTCHECGGRGCSACNGVGMTMPIEATASKEQP